jgi:hypothetical protein
MEGLINIIPIIIPLLCLLIARMLHYIFFSSNESVITTCEDVQNFAKELESSLEDIGTFSGKSERLIAAGEFTCPHINEKPIRSKAAKKLNWYAHTRHYYFAGSHEMDQTATGTTEDWLRRQLKASMGE